MIVDGFAFLALLIGFVGAVVYAERGLGWRIFGYLPGIVVIYFGVMLLSSLGVWSQSQSVNETYTALKTNLLPSMIFLMLLQGDLRNILKLSRRMLLTFLLASVSIAIGFVGMFALFSGYFESEAWKPFAALCGSWMGGPGNMVAIQGALGVADSQMGYILLIDSIDYALWFMLLLSLVPYARGFDRWSGASVDERRVKLSDETPIESRPTFESLMLLLAVALGVSALASWGGGMLPVSQFVTTSTWVVIIATLLGVTAAMTPLSKLGGSSELGNIHLYIIVALIASRANFGELTQAPLYITAGLVIITIHALIMVGFAKLFKLDLFTIAIASLANIGGVASAPILAATYSRSLVPIAILMSMLGYIIGTFGGLMVGRVLMMMG